MTLLLSFFPQSAVAAVLEKVTNQRLEDGREVVNLFLAGHSDPKIFSLPGDSPRLVLDFPDTRYHHLGQQKIAVDGALLRAIRIFTHPSPLKTRVVFDLRSGAKIDYSQEFLENGHILRISLPGNGRTPPGKATTATPLPAEPLVAAPAPVKKETAALPPAVPKAKQPIAALPPAKEKTTSPLQTAPSAKTPAQPPSAVAEKPERPVVAPAPVKKETVASPPTEPKAKQPIAALPLAQEKTASPLQAASSAQTSTQPPPAVAEKPERPVVAPAPVKKETVASPQMGPEAKQPIAALPPAQEKTASPLQAAPSAKTPTQPPSATAEKPERPVPTAEKSATSSPFDSPFLPTESPAKPAEKAEPAETTTPVVRMLGYSLGSQPADNDVLRLQLDGYAKPEITAHEGRQPQIVCFFPKIRLALKKGSNKPLSGKFVRKVTVTGQEKPSGVKVVLDLEGGYDYDIQQIFVKDESAFLLVVNTSNR